jgi:hypothetical protein
MKNLILIILAVLVVAPGEAQEPQESAIALRDLSCLPKEHNAPLQFSVSEDAGGSSVWLYFRRLNPVGAFYFVQAWAAGDGDYWTVFPKPEDREQLGLSEDWWEVLEDRDWMEGHDREWLEDWLSNQENEATEYYVAVKDTSGRITARTEMQLVSVQEQDECIPDLTPPERGWAQNLTVGEAASIQAAKQVFHWLCDGIVTRLSVDGVLRGDDYCRACVIANIDPVQSSIHSVFQLDISWRPLCS